MSTQLKALRAKHKIHATTLADLMNVNLSGYYRRENGEVELKLSEIKSIINFIKEHDESATFDTIFMS